MNALADLIVTTLALLATALALIPLGAARRESAVAARMSALLIGLVLLLGARLLAWSGSAAAAVPLMIVASWLPLLALRVAEQIVRRHAAASVKWLVLGGGVAFTVAALVFGAWWSAPVLVALATFQAATILCAVTHIARARDISPSEAQLGRVFAAALLLALPLTLSDFQAIVHLPVRGGAFAMLLLVLATSRFVAGTVSLASLFIDIAVVMGSGAVVASSAALILVGLPLVQAIQIGAVGAAAAAVALIVQRRGEARLVLRARPSLTRTLAALPDQPSLNELLAAHPLLASGRLVEGEMLSAYPPAQVAALLERRVATRGAGDAARDLLDATAATHLLRLSQAPPRLLAVSAGALAGDDIASELDLVARLASR